MILQFSNIHTLKRALANEITTLAAHADARLMLGIEQLGTGVGKRT